jgi:hypothetical protein
MEMSSDGGTGAQEKQVTVAYDGGGCKREQRNETMTWAIYNVQTWGTPGREPRPDADHGKDRTGDHHLVNRLVGLTQAVFSSADSVAAELLCNTVAQYSISFVLGNNCPNID